MRRKPDPDARRRDLCDAAIDLLAEDGAKGLSHLKIDRKLGFPDGTTSFYFRTRTALIHAVAERVTELDLAELSAAMVDPSGLAKLVMRSRTGPPFVRTKVRFELVLQANRDPELAAILQRYADRHLELIRDAVRRHHPSGPDADVTDEQAYILMTFISGVMLSFTAGDHTITSAEHLDGVMSDVVSGIVNTRGRAASRAPRRAREV